MRPFFDDRFPGLPKFLWFDNGSGGDGSGGDGSGGDGGTGGDAGAAGGDSGVGGSGGTSATDSSATGTGNDAAPAAPSATGFSVGQNAAGPAAGQAAGAAPGPGATSAGAAGGTSGPGAGAAAGGSGGATGPGAATGGAATGGGGGTAAGGSGVSALSPSVIAQLNAALGASPTDALRGAVNLSQLDFGGGGASTGFPSLGVPLGVGGQGAAPVGQVTVSPLGPPSAGGQTSLGNSQTGDQVSPPGFPAFRGVPATNMGFPAAALAHTPTGGYASSQNAPVGSTIGQSTISANPANMPSVHAHNADGGGGGGGTGLSGLAQAASTAVAQSPAAPVSAVTQAANSPTSSPSLSSPMTGIMETILNLVAGYPPLAQLAQQALQG